MKYYTNCNVYIFNRNFLTQQLWACLYIHGLGTCSSTSLLANISIFLFKREAYAFTSSISRMRPFILSPRTLSRNTFEMRSGMCYFAVTDSLRSRAHIYNQHFSPRQPKKIGYNRVNQVHIHGSARFTDREHELFRYFRTVELEIVKRSASKSPILILSDTEPIVKMTNSFICEQDQLSSVCL